MTHHSVPKYILYFLIGSLFDKRSNINAQKVIVENTRYYLMNIFNTFPMVVLDSLFLNSEHIDPTDFSSYELYFVYLVIFLRSVRRTISWRGVLILVVLIVFLSGHFLSRCATVCDFRRRDLPERCRQSN